MFGAPASVLVPPSSDLFPGASVRKPQSDVLSLPSTRRSRSISAAARDRRVAIKLAHHLDPGARHRFRAERQALPHYDHPAIGRAFEADLQGPQLDG